MLIIRVLASVKLRFTSSARTKMTTRRHSDTESQTIRFAFVNSLYTSDSIQLRSLSAPVLICPLALYYAPVTFAPINVDNAAIRKRRDAPLSGGLIGLGDSAGMWRRIVR
jgi:hypothetical protein